MQKHQNPAGLKTAGFEYGIREGDFKSASASKSRGASSKRPISATADHRDAPCRSKAHQELDPAVETGSQGLRANLVLKLVPHIARPGDLSIAKLKGKHMSGSASFRRVRMIGRTEVTMQLVNVCVK